MKELASIQAIIHGRVQGVFYRDCTLRKAKELGLVGCVRNLPDASKVEVLAEGDKEELGKLVNWLDVGSPESTVERVDSNWSEYTGSYPDFRIKY